MLSWLEPFAVGRKFELEPMTILPLPLSFETSTFPALRPYHDVVAAGTEAPAGISTQQYVV